MRLERAGYAIELSEDGLHATLLSPQGEHWLTLVLGAALDRVGVVDETLAIAPPLADGDTVTVRRVSTAWGDAGVTLVCGEQSLEIRTWVEGDGRLTDVHLLAGRLLLATKAPGLHPSGSSFRTLFSPNPGDPSKLVRAATESAVLGTSGDGALGRGHWFFTPPPYWLAFAAEDVFAPDEPTRGGWLGLGLAAPPSELGFVQAVYRPADRAFHLVLEYEGHTEVSGRFEAPTLVLTPGATTAYDGLRAHRDELAVRGAAPPVSDRVRPTWWREPIFCGWGAQCALSARAGGPASAHATQSNYDAFLYALSAHGVVPGTVVIDDKWQVSYGLNEPDESKWPDLAGWIRGRHEAGQRVLLWWKAWDAEGLPGELCIRSPDGTALGLDPTNPATRRVLADVMSRLVGAGGLGADGLKIDFTARTPSGHALRAYAAGWGTALLHELLSLVYAEVKKSNPEALVITHAPHPGFADVTDMIRLNDMLRLDDPGPLPAASVVQQMRYRARVASAAMPDVLVDTDDWCVPDKRTWRAYLEEKPSLGVPSLYYATHLDLSGEALDEDDYAALRRIWSDWRRAG